MEKDFSEYIRRGARITLRALVLYVNSRLESKWEADAINKASYIWKNTGGSSKRTFVKNDAGQIKWDLGNITEFIGRGSKQGQEIQKISDTEPTINFKKTLFNDLREDFFTSCISLSKIRNYFSHYSFDGNKEEGIIYWDDADHYLRLMRSLIKNITTDKNLNIQLEKIIQEFEKEERAHNDFLSNEEIINKEKENPTYKNQEIDLSSVNILRSVQNSSVVNAKGEKAQCISLYFTDTDIERKMYNYFDKDGSIEKKCRSLIGKKVMTTAWNPKVYDPQKWFRNIYQAADLDKVFNNVQDANINSYEEMYPHDNYKSSHPPDDDIPF